MCGGVIFPYRKEYKEVLEQYYSPADLEKFEATGEVRSLYWQKSEPVLPVIESEHDADGAETEPKLLLWGNRDKKKSLPQTGWARLESIEEGKWGYLKPRPVMIPVDYGVEKGKWFGIEHGIAGLVIEKAGEERVYMLTQAADDEFLGITHHDRMPALIDQDAIGWLPGDPDGTVPATQASLSFDE